MSRFFFARTSVADVDQDQEAKGRRQMESIASSLMEAQSITVAAIFAALVGKGVFDAEEAAGHMREIAAALKIDIRTPAGAGASSLLESYAQALTVAQN